MTLTTCLRICLFSILIFVGTGATSFAEGSSQGGRKKSCQDMSLLDLFEKYSEQFITLNTLVKESANVAYSGAQEDVGDLGNFHYLPSGITQRSRITSAMKNFLHALKKTNRHIETFSGAHILLLAMSNVGSRDAIEATVSDSNLGRLRAFCEHKSIFEKSSGDGSYTNLPKFSKIISAIHNDLLGN